MFCILYNFLHFCHYLSMRSITAFTWLRQERPTDRSWTFPVKHKLLQIETKLTSVYRLRLTVHPKTRL